MLLEYGSHIDYVDSKGRAPLSRTASVGSVSVAKVRSNSSSVIRILMFEQLLIDNGADIETRDDGGSTSLAYAAFYGHYQVVEVRVE